MKIQGMRMSSAALLLAALVLWTPALAWALDETGMQAVLKELDERQRSSGDYKAVVFIDQKQKDKSDLLYETVIYRRDRDNQLVILFSKPKAEAGKGYLRIDKNLFLYDPSVGKWERRTDRERIGGTSSQRADFDESRLAEEFSPRYVGEEKLGNFQVHHLELKAKPGVDAAYPILKIWVDTKTGNLLKQEDFALSGRKMRTLYYPKWDRLMSESKGTFVYFPKEIRIFDEVEKGNRTTLVFQNVELKKLPDNVFTKAWLESKSR